MSTTNIPNEKLKVWSIFFMGTIALFFFDVNRITAEVVQKDKKEKSNGDLSNVQKLKHNNWLGLSYAIYELSDRNYIAISGIFPNSPATRTELRKWDKILTVADKPVGTVREITEIINTFSPGTEIAIQYKRDSKVFQTKIQLAGKEDIKDFLGKNLPIDHLKDSANGKSLNINIDKSKIKVIYFWYTGFPPSVRIREKIEAFISKWPAKNIQLITLTFLDDDATDKPKDPLRPSYRLSDFHDLYSMTFRVHQYPAIIVADRENVIRFANYVDETTIAKPLGIIEELQRQIASAEKK